MENNLGPLDRSLRIIVGAALLASAMGIYGQEYMYGGGWLGLVPFLSGLAGWCPMYSLIGITSCKSRGGNADV